MMKNGIAGVGILLFAAAALASMASARPASGQEVRRLFPPRSSFPDLLAGPRDPRTSITLLGVTENPNAFGSGAEAEVSIGSNLPILLLGDPGGSPLVAGIEGAVFARFGLQVLERELIASDWLFAVPVYWLRRSGWLRFRYFHTSSHLGDEYARRFEDSGINFSRDAAELMAFRRVTPDLGVYGGARYAYIVHPEESDPWVLRIGAEWRGDEGRRRTFKPFAASDIEWDQDAGHTPRIHLTGGIWLPEIQGGGTLRLSLGLLTGPSPMGQFNGGSTTQIGLGIMGVL